MSTTTERKVKKDKKERSSKKRKAIEPAEDNVEAPMTTETAPSPPPTSEVKSKKKSSKKESSTAPSEPETTIDSSEPPAKKRKSSTIPTEIEVDITAPTPPTKRALRLLKKGKAAPRLKPDNRPDDESEPEPENSAEDGTGTKDKAKKKSEVEKRSEHGVWIGNLPWSCDKTVLRNFFTTNSDITDEAITRIHMPSPADTHSANTVTPSARKQHNKGFAYVDFASAENVTQALELSEELLTGRRVLIKDQKSFEGRPQKTKEEKLQQGKPPNKRVFVGNLRFDTTINTLKEHFAPCGAVADCFVATFEDTGKCKGYAWVTFEELEAAAHAVAGFVMVPMEDEDDDHNSEADSSEGTSDSEDEDSASKKPKVAMRKKWVNQIYGRPIRREYAEDAQVRYKKRYGKDGTKAAGGDRRDVESTAAANDAAGAVPQAKPADFYRNSYAPRLTGGVVESTGKKVVF